MRFFAVTLFVAALVAHAVAKPPLHVDLDVVSLPADLPIVLNGQVSDAVLGARYVGAPMDNVFETVSTDPALHSRGEPSASLAVIFSNLISETHPYVDQLGCLTPENSPKSVITGAFTAMDASFAAVLPQIQALAGQNASVALASVDGHTTLSLSELAAITGQYFSLVSTAVDSISDLRAAQSRAETSPSVLRQIAAYDLLSIVALVGGLASSY